MKMNNGKKVERYDFEKKPAKVNFLLPIARIGSWFMQLSRKHKVEHIGKKITTPSLIIANHASFNDFYCMYDAIRTNRINYVIALDAYNDINDFLIRSIGGIAKRKFISDMALMKNMRYAVNTLKHSVLMYPEARYSLDGTTSYLPESLGKCVKFLNVPLVMLKLHGCYVTDPQWNKYKDKRIPTYTTVEEIVSQEEIKTLTVEQINQRIKEKFEWDDWAYLRNSDGKIKTKNRAYNLNALLYQCPNCKTEYKMEGKGVTLTCTECGKEWEMDEKGVLTAKTGETEFSYVPDWFKWQKENVIKEVESGAYIMESDCNVFTLPSCKGFHRQGRGKLIQNSYGTTLKVNLYGEDKEIFYNGNMLESVHIEYNYKGEGDMLDFSIHGDSIWMQVDKKDIITKVSLATEAIRDFCHKNKTKE